MAGTLEQLTSLVKALEAGNYNAAPSSLIQGAALQTEDLSPVMNNVTFSDEHLKLQKLFKVATVKSTLAQFDRQLSYGILGGSAQLEGAIGSDETSEFVRVVVPMAYYSHVRRVTLVANMVSTVDGKKAEDRAASDAAKKLAADIEFDLLRGKSDFQNAGVYDANPMTIPGLANMMGFEAQVRQSDGQRNAHDLMFGEYGSDESIVIQGGGTLKQDMIEDASVRTAMNFGSADKLLVDPIVLSAYNKLTYKDKERIILAGSPQDASGADFRRQWVSGGTVAIEASRFLSGKTRPTQARKDGPSAPVISATAAVAASGTGFKLGEEYSYYATACNEIGESPRSATVKHTVVADGDANKLTLTLGGGNQRFYNVYRGAEGVGAGDEAKFKFIGRVAYNPTATYFFDAGNKAPGFVTGILVQGDTAELKELSPYSRLKLAVVDLSVPEAHFRFLTLAVTQPRKNCLIDNLTK